MTDAAIPDVRRHGGRRVGESGSAHGETAADLAGRLKCRSLERAGPASLPAADGRSARGGLGRWLLDGLVVSFAFGGCIHSIHPDYADFLRDLSKSRERKSQLR